MPFEAGIGALRANFIRETTPGTTPTNPDWLRFSDEMDSIGGWVPNANLAARTAIGSPDVQGFSIGAEDHEVSVSYKLQRWLTTSGEVPNDALADGLLRDANGFLPNTHSFLSRQILSNEGTQSGGDLHIYTYGTGGKFETARLSGDPGDSEPVLAEGTYRFEKVRSYAVSQPNASTTMTVVSSSTADTSQDVEVENLAGSTSETISLNGTTPVAGATSFTDVGAVRLSAETAGDVTVTFTTGSETCVVILGSESHQNIEGDLGLPLLGTGSYEAALNTSFEHILGDTITKGGSAIDVNVMTMAIEVANNIQADAVTRQKTKVLNEGMRDLTAQATVFSARGSHDATIEHLKATAGDIVWTLDGGTITLAASVLTAPGPRTYEKGAATMQRDNTFTGTDLTITP
jgi:hypothetical protein